MEFVVICVQFYLTKDSPFVYLPQDGIGDQWQICIEMLDWGNSSDNANLVAPVGKSKVSPCQ